MNTKQRYGSATLRRVQQFLDSHADVVGSINQSVARQELDAAYADTIALVNEQGTRTRTGRGERSNQATLERSLKRLHLTPIVKFARASLRGVPNFSALTPNVRPLSGDRLVKAANALIAAAEPYAAAFIAGHFPEDFNSQARQATSALQTSIEARSNEVVKRVGATRQIEETVKRGRAAIVKLDAVLARILDSDPRLAVEWQTAKRIQSRPGPVVTPPATTTTAPEVKAAA
jgi:hypothetical protein